jgi:hypothetical protein
MTTELSFKASTDALLNEALRALKQTKLSYFGKRRRRGAGFRNFSESQIRVVEVRVIATSGAQLPEADPEPLCRFPIDSLFLKPFLLVCPLITCVLHVSRIIAILG